MSCSDRLVMEIKQGENRGFEFTLEQLTLDNQYGPIDLTNSIIKFEVRLEPYMQVKPFITKQITNNDSLDGIITAPTNGKFTVNFYYADFINYPPRDYYLSVYVVEVDDSIENGYITTYSISATDNDMGIIRFCKC